MKIVRRLLLLGTFLAINGCTGLWQSGTAVPALTGMPSEQLALPQASIEAPRSTATAALVNLPKNTLTPTVTAVIMPTATPTPILPPPNEIELRCLFIDTPIPEMPITNQGIVINDNEAGHPEKRLNLLFDLNTRTTQPFVIGSSALVSIAPNGQNLAYYDKNGLLKISDVQGKDLYSIDMPEKRQWGGWFDSQRVYLYDRTDRDYPPYKLMIHNIVSGEETHLNATFPNRDAVQTLRVWNLSYVSYSPTLSQAFYLTQQPYHIVLWDLNNNQELASIPVSDPSMLPQPQWSADGSQAIVVSNYGMRDQFWLVSKDGSMRPLLNDLDFIKLELGGFAWSPDDSKITFWLQGKGGADFNGLSILDIGSGKIVYYCISASIYNTPAPIWSPDGRFLVANVFDASSHNYVSIVDSQNGEIFPIGEVGFEGWVILP